MNRTDAFDLHDAFAFAERRHAGQIWKDGATPWIQHPLAVASLVLRHGGNEAQARAALIHDALAQALDDALPDGGLTPEQAVARFGADAVRIAEVFRDPELPPGADRSWSGLRKAYLAKLGQAPARIADDALLVVACEELHELSDLLHGLRFHGAAAWKRFPVHGMEVFWYFRELLGLFNARLAGPHGPLVSEFGARLKELQPQALPG